MQRSLRDNSMELLTLPPLPILEVLRRLNARSLVALQQTNSYFSRKEPGSRLPLLEHVAREKVLALAGGDPAQAQRFRLVHCRPWGP